MVRPGQNHKSLNLFTSLLAWVLIIFSGCDSPTTKPPSTTQQTAIVPINAPKFNADSAFAFVKQQVDFGPRVPNTKAHADCANWMTEKLKEYADTVIVQSFQVRAFDGKVLNSRNIIASFHPDLGNRIMLCAHWDTRPFADQDAEKQNEPIDGANDGGSGVGVLMEVARHLSIADPQLGVDIILFDVEDYGQPDDSDFPTMEDSYCLGSQYWTKNLHVSNYKARYGILLDMVGSANVQFYKEGTSVQFANDIVDKVWNIAAATGFGSSFVNQQRNGIIDDHYYINKSLGFKIIDLIHFEESSPSKFWKHWHTHEDTIDKIDKNSLYITGQTVLEVLFREVPN
jgi:glutaminyl-peptide cyclotransferase